MSRDAIVAESGVAVSSLLTEDELARETVAPVAVHVAVKLGVFVLYCSFALLTVSLV
jgi:hypothetical protein